MNWTTTPPTKPGKYYWRYDKDSNWHIFDVDDGGRLGLIVECEPAKKFGGEWGGEVPSPEEVEGTREQNEHYYKAILSLWSEVDCRIQHGADSNGHLEYVQSKLNALLKQEDKQ